MPVFLRVEHAANVGNEQIARLELPGIVQEVVFDELNDRRMLHFRVGNGALLRKRSDGEERDARAVRLAVELAAWRRRDVIEIAAPFVPRQQDERVVRVSGTEHRVHQAFARTWCQRSRWFRTRGALCGSRRP